MVLNTPRVRQLAKLLKDQPVYIEFTHSKNSRGRVTFNDETLLDLQSGFDPQQMADKTINLLKSLNPEVNQLVH